MSYRVLADIVLVVHAGFALAVALGLLLVWIGGWRGWAWVREPRLRVAHLVAIGVVASQAWLGVDCPLTSLEMALRARAGEATYAGGFIAHWIHAVLFYRAPTWVFVAVYSGFALLVAASWWLVPPRRFRRSVGGSR